VGPSLPPRRSLLGVLIASAGCFLALALAVSLLPSLPGDVSAREALLAVASPAVVAAMRAINYAGSWRVLLPATILLLVAMRGATDRWWIWIALMIAAPATEGTLKLVIGRPRPEAASMGFPSGHATAAGAFFGAVFFLSESLQPSARRLVRAAAVVIIALVAAARVILRDHWPSDALAGICLGLALASAAALLTTPRARPAQANRSKV
jgi:membrane-associated phospholipid phosphatase